MLECITEQFYHNGCCYERDKEGIVQEIFYTDDLVLMAETMAEQREKSHSWKRAIESKGVKVNLVKTKVTVSKVGQIIVK